MSSKEKCALEIERKYIIEMPDVAILLKEEKYSSSEILQIYLPSEQGMTHRIRRRIFQDRTQYTETVKLRVDKMSSEEREGELSAEQFTHLSINIKEGTRPLNKTRHTFLYLGQLFEIDIYPEWHHTAIMETELSSRETQVKMPEFIRIIKEVTGDKAYSNASMSREFPKEETQS